MRRRAFPLCGALYIRSGPLTKELLLDLDQRGGLFGDLLVSLGQLQLQDAVLELGGNIGGLQVLAYIEAAGTAAGAALLADVAALVVLLVQILTAVGGDGQVAVLQVLVEPYTTKNIEHNGRL